MSFFFWFFCGLRKKEGEWCGGEKKKEEGNLEV